MDRLARVRLLQQRVVGQQWLTCLTPGGQGAVSDWTGIGSIPIGNAVTGIARMPLCRHRRSAHPSWCRTGQEGRARPFHRRAGLFHRAAAISDGATERWGAGPGDTRRLSLFGTRYESPTNIEGDGSTSLQDFLKISAGRAPTSHAHFAAFHAGKLVTCDTLWRSNGLVIDAYGTRELTLTQFWFSRTVALQGDDPMVQCRREAPLDGRSPRDHQVQSYPQSLGRAQRWQYTQSYVTQQARNS